MSELSENDLFEHLPNDSSDVLPVVRRSTYSAQPPYTVIYADPPWSYNRGVYQDGEREERTLDEQYATMRQDELESLGVREIADKDCALFMWTTDSHLLDALKLMRVWGFDYRTIAFIWVKRADTWQVEATVGAWTMKNCEICLLGVRGNMLQHKKVNNIYQVVESKRTKHSKKPNEVRRRIERLFGDVPRVELFARQASEGWACWGNEVQSDIELRAVVL